MLHKQTKFHVLDITGLENNQRTLSNSSKYIDILFWSSIILLNGLTFCYYDLSNVTDVLISFESINLNYFRKKISKQDQVQYSNEYSH